MTITLDVIQALTLMVAVFSCAVNIFIAMIGFQVTRAKKPIGIFFIISFLGLAWITLFVGLAKTGFGSFFAPIVVMAPMFSGYILVSYYLFCRSVVFPSEKPPLALYALGIFGTLFAAIILITPDGAELLHRFIMDDDVVVPTRLLVAFSLHSLALLSVVIMIFRVLVMGSIITKDREQREARKSLMIGIIVIIIFFLLTNIAPIFGVSETIIVAPFSTLLMAWMAWRLLRTTKTDDSPNDATMQEINTRLESLGRLARGIAHDYNNLLAGLVGHAELGILKVDDSKAVKNHLETIVNMGQQAADLTHDLIALSAKGSASFTPIKLESITADTINACRSTLDADVIVEEQIEHHLPMVAISESAYSSLLMNLMLNAHAALDGLERRITVSLRFEDESVVPSHALGEPLDTRPTVCLEVIDTGCGMKPDIKAHMYDPFFSTKPRGKGLGLANVLSTVREASGAIACDSRVEEGTCFRVWLPVVSDISHSPEMSKSVVVVDGPRADVILVEDDEVVAPALMEMIQSIGYRCSMFSTAESALSYFIENQAKPHLLVCDICLPGMSGIDLVTHLQKLGHFPTLMISGNERSEGLSGLAHQEDLVFLSKPLTRNQISRALAEIHP